MSSTVPPAPLVSATWLRAHLDDDNIAVIDVSWYLPAMNRDGAAEYKREHIPGAVFFDLDGVADHSTDLPHMLPAAEVFAAAVGAMGVGDDTQVVVYDGAGIFSAPRLWWMFHVFGHKRVAVLDGGLPAWKSAGGPVDANEPAPRPRAFTPRFNADMVVDFAEVAAILASGAAQVFDARPAQRFHGQAPEPRPGLKSGHMPGSLSLPASALITGGYMKSTAEILAAFEAAGADPSKSVVTSCGSGVSAAILTLGLASAGKPLGRLYDGSWSDWGARAGSPVAT